MNPLDRLDLIAEQLRLVCGDAENSTWLRSGVDLHIRDGASLDKTLGLCGVTTGRSARFKRLRREMAMYLREALWHCGGNQALLANKIRTFRTTKWPTRKYRDKLPDDWPATSHLIHSALRLGISVPETGQGIGKLLRNEIPG